MRKIGDHAVVLGAGMAGLLAARVLADAYERVTVVERDPLPDDGGESAGCPAGPARPPAGARAGRRSSTNSFRACSTT